MFKIVIVDDHQLFRKSIALYLRTIKNLTISALYADAESLLRDIHIVRPDLLLMDIQMPGMDGLEAAKQVRMQYPETKILIVSQLMDSHSLKTAVDIGVNGYCTKFADLENLSMAIAEILDGGFYFDHKLSEILRAQLINPVQKPNEAKNLFTAREISILKMACLEHNSQEIAERLFINIKTVETHRKHIMAKSGSRNFLGAVLFALKNGYIFLESTSSKP